MLTFLLKVPDHICILSKYLVSRTRLIFPFCVHTKNEYGSRDYKVYWLSVYCIDLLYAEWLRGSFCFVVYGYAFMCM